MANVILTFKKNKLYSGNGGSNPLLTIDGNKVYQGNGGGALDSSAPSLTIKKGKVYSGHGGGALDTRTPLATIKKNKVYSGHGGNTPFITIKGNKVSQNTGSPSLGMDIDKFVGALIATGAVKISGKGGCFIATATMGDYDHPVVLELYTPENQLFLRKVKTNSVNGLYDFRMKTDTESPTGNWLAKIKVGGSTFTKSIKLKR